MQRKTIAVAHLCLHWALTVQRPPTGYWWLVERQSTCYSHWWPNSVILWFIVDGVGREAKWQIVHLQILNTFSYRSGCLKREKYILTRRIKHLIVYFFYTYQKHVSRNLTITFTSIRTCYITLRNSSPVVVFLCRTENAITVIHTIRLSTISRAAVVPRVTPSVRCDVGQEASAEERKLHDIQTSEQTLQIQT